jgi:hypothetical protein
MNDLKMKKIKTIQRIIEVLFLLGVALSIYLDYRGIIHVTPWQAFVLLGVVLIERGVFGLIRNDIRLRNFVPVEYSKGSIAGKLINAAIIVVGIAMVIFGIIY